MPNENDVFKATGIVLRRLREGRGITLADVADELGRTTSWLSMLENGKASTTISNLISILSIYNCSLSYFFQLVEDERRQEVPENDYINKFVAKVANDEWQEFPLVTGGITYRIPPPEGRLYSSNLDITPADIKPGKSSGKISHPGEEILYILKGELKINFYHKLEDNEPFGSLMLKQHDTVHFFTSFVHEGINPNSEKRVEFLIIRSPGVFK